MKSGSAYSINYITLYEEILKERKQQRATSRAARITAAIRDKESKGFAVGKKSFWCKIGIHDWAIFEKEESLSFYFTTKICQCKGCSKIRYYEGVANGPD